jgi:hypothetical protein
MTLALLTGDECQEALLALDQYVTSGKLPEVSGRVHIAIESILPTLGKSLHRYESCVENGKKPCGPGKTRGRPKTQKTQVKPEGKPKGEKTKTRAKPKEKPKGENSKTQVKPEAKPKAKPNENLSSSLSYSSSSSSSLQQEEEFPLPLSENPENQKPPGVPFSRERELKPAGGDLGEKLGECVQAYARIGILPPFRGTVLDMPAVNRPGVLKTLGNYSREEICGEAMPNYFAIENDPKRPWHIKYNSIWAFLEKGVSQYVNEAKPFERFKNERGPPGEEDRFAGIIAELEGEEKSREG